jgi:hypothetical protein
LEGGGNLGCFVTLLVILSLGFYGLHAQGASHPECVAERVAEGGSVTWSKIACGEDDANKALKTLWKQFWSW